MDPPIMVKAFSGQSYGWISWATKIYEGADSHWIQSKWNIMFSPMSQKDRQQVGIFWPLLLATKGIFRLPFHWIHHTQMMLTNWHVTLSIWLNQALRIYHLVNQSSQMLSIFVINLIWLSTDQRHSSAIRYVFRSCNRLQAKWQESHCANKDHKGRDLDLHLKKLIVCSLLCVHSW